MSNDKKTIGVTSVNSRTLEELMATGKFETEIDAAKFAMAYAIKSGTTAATCEGAATKWNAGSFDPDGSIRTLLEALYPATEEPYRLVEYLLNEGFKLLSEKPSGESVDLYRVLFEKKPKGEIDAGVV